MATYATDLQTFDLADSATGWAELSGHQSGASPSATTENFYHNSIAVDQATGQGVNQTCGVQYDNGSAVTWTSGWAFFAWQKFDAGTNIFSWSVGGMRIGIGSSSGNMNFWNALGDDFGNYPTGGWQNTAIDPETTADQTDGSPVAGSYQLFGSMPNMRAKITKGSPHVVDAIRYGRGEISVIGTGATFADMALANDAVTARWGLFSKDGNAFEWKGLMSLGLTASSVTMTDSGIVINIADTPRVSAGFNRLEINHASSVINLDKVTINGNKTSITGSAPVSKGEIEVIDDATLNLNDWGLNYIGTSTWQSNSTLTRFTWTECETVTQGGATIIDPSISSPVGTGMIVDNLNLVTGGNFTSSGTGHAMDLGNFSADTSLSYDNIDTGYALTDGSTGNETILIDVDSGITVTINVAGGGATTPTIYNTGLGTVTVVENLVTLTITGHPVGSTVILYALDSGNDEELGTRLATFEPSSATEIYQYAGGDAGGDIQVKMIETGYRNYSELYTLGAGDALYTINAKLETN